MSRQEYIRASIAIAASQLFPKIAREAIIADAKFTESFGIKADAIVLFGSQDLAFQRSALLGAIRRAFDPGQGAMSVEDTRGDVWEVSVQTDQSPPQITLAREAKRFFIGHFGLLSPDQDVRLSILLREADVVGLPRAQIAVWNQLLEERVPTDDECAAIQDDLKNTPVAVAGAIRDNLASGSVSLDILAPRSPQYYERLVGKYENEASLEDYVARGARGQFQELLRWRDAEGLKLALLLAPQPFLSAALAEAEIDEGNLEDVIRWLAEKGDSMSCAAGIEIALSRLAGNDRLKVPLAQLLKVLIAGNPVVKVDQITLFSSLILTVYGEIAHCRVLAGRPPFWRRLAAIAQASLIAQCIADVGGDATELADWLHTVRLQLFLLQCYADLRLEPRWLPDFALQQQLTNEIFGRVWTAAGGLPEGVLEPELRDLLLGDGEGSLARRFNPILAGLPGPLEGGVLAPLELDAEVAARIEDELSSSNITAESFTGLMNAAHLLRIPVELADMAGDALARVGYRLPHDSESTLVGHLLGLASTAAVSRSCKLADALFLLLRTYRNFHPDELTIDDAFRIAIIACASRSELADWCRRVGDFMIDFAFQPITTDEATRLHSHLTHLCHLVPELWSTCGQAEAALRSVLRA